MRGRSQTRFVAGLAIFAVAALACHAAKPEPLLDTMTDEFEAAAAKWEQSISAFALRLFYLLATLDVIWTGLVIALKGSGLQEFVAELVRRLLFIGFFLALLLNAHDWSRAIVNSFQEIGTKAVSDTVGPGLDTVDFGRNGELKPSAIAAKGTLYSRRVANSAPSIFVHPGGAVFFGFASLWVLLGFGAIAARQVLVLAEMYVVLSAGTVLLGFGASRWTNDYALKYLRYCVSVGAKLMFVQISVALAIHFLGSLLSKSSTVSFTRASSLTLSLTVLAVLIWTIPNIVAQMLQGASATTGNELGLAGSMARAAAGGAIPGAGGGAGPLHTAMALAGRFSGNPSMNAASRIGSTLAMGMARPLGAVAQNSGTAKPGGGDAGRSHRAGAMAPPAGAPASASTKANRAAEEARNAG
jgi:P-type conjugative transfer protein TrbL